MAAPARVTATTETSARSAFSARRDVLLLFAAWLIIYFVPLGWRPLSNPDEGRYVEIAREITVTHDHVSPRLNGVLYFEKPPLFYWLEATAVSAGGMNYWALRFWPAFLAFLGAAAVYGTGRALWGRDGGWWSALALMFSLLYFGLANIIILDMAVSVFITWALCAFILAVRAPPGPRRFRWCCAFYISMVLALLTKGLIGVLIPGAVAFLWLLLLNRWRELRHTYLFEGLLVFLILGLPWHVAAALANPPPGGWDWARFFSSDWHNQGFLWYYFVHEHVLRYLNPGTANRVAPWWFFLAILPAGFLPWTVFLPQAVRAACTGGWTRLKSEPEIPALLLWAIFPLAFFSLSSSKLIPYILPSVPPLALLTGRYLALALNVQKGAALLWPLRILALLGVVLGMAMLSLPSASIQGIPDSTFNLFRGLGGFFLVGGAGTAWMLRPRSFNVQRSLLAITFVVAVFLFNTSFLAGRFIEMRRPSTAAAAAFLKPVLQPDDRVVVLGDYGPYQDFAPLLGRTVGIAGHLPDEQEFGTMLEADEVAERYSGLKEFLALRQQPGVTPAQLDAALMPPFLDWLHGAGRVFVLVSAKKFPDFLKSHPDASVHVWWSNDDFVIFSNHPKPADHP